MILDIRKQKEEVTGIKFDDSADYISWDEDCFIIMKSYGNRVPLCTYDDFDNFIAAFHKARELAGK